MAETTDEREPSRDDLDPRRVAGLHYKLRKSRDEFAAVAKERDSLAASVAALTKERDDLARKADASAAAKQVEKLTAELRGMKHRRVFDAAAAKAGARPDAVGDLWSLSGYAPDVDDPDEAAIAALVEEQKTSRPYLFAEAAKDEKAAPKSVEKPAEVSKPGPGAGRGGLVKESGKFRVRSSDLRSREWMAKWQSRYATELAAGNVELVD